MSGVGTTFSDSDGSFERAIAGLDDLRALDVPIPNWNVAARNPSAGLTEEQRSAFSRLPIAGMVNLYPITITSAERLWASNECRGRIEAAIESDPGFINMLNALYVDTSEQANDSASTIQGRDRVDAGVIAASFVTITLPNPADAEALLDRYEDPGYRQRQDESSSQFLQDYNAGLITVGNVGQLAMLDQIAASSRDGLNPINRELTRATLMRTLYGARYNAYLDLK